MGKKTKTRDKTTEAGITRKHLTDHKFPEDLRTMDYEDLEILSYELRDFLIDSVSKTGGHLAPNLGIVEITLALHRCFDTPKDKLIWDVGHQSYVHKILTGRIDEFVSLRQHGGISGFPKSSESEYDCFDTGHSSNSISIGLGMATARDLRGEDYNVVSIIGDGALSGGLAFEALNNAGSSKTNMIILLNDNGMSISKNTGGLSSSLGRITSTDKYIHTKTQIKKGLSKVPIIGDSVVSGIHHAKENIKYAVIDGILFEELGCKYIGPVDGHNIKELCETLEHAKGIQGPVFIHAVTQKGKGYTKAENNPNVFHGIGPFDIDSGKPIKKSKDSSNSEVFGKKLVDLAKKDERIVAISAAMTEGVGLKSFAAKFPKRFFDVGIAEGHAVTFAAGMAKQGLKPFAAIYSTFLQRAYDEIVEDVCLQNLPVVLCIDRAGVVGEDGSTHHGLFDISYLKNLPNMTFMAPSNGKQLEKALELAQAIDSPCAIRYPRGASIKGDTFDIQIGQSHTVKEGKDAVIWAFGPMISLAVEAAELLADEGIDVGIVDGMFIRPMDKFGLYAAASKYPLIVTLEDGVISGGAGESIRAILADQQTKIINMGWPDQFIEHGSQKELYAQYGLDAAGIADTVRKGLSR
ncbi:MAG: 1-deoxy-D-xylulose-5-phosphate synthase [Firmicutes bacterium]|nr:1-deoxy-D-xylulose-5-phosphate synthase [Bacillota bacterium]